MTEVEARERFLEALEMILCKHGRSTTFAALISDVLMLLEMGVGDLPPMLLVANPSPDHLYDCRSACVPCPPIPKVEGVVVSGELCAEWERRVRKLTKPCEPLSGFTRRVVEATWDQTRSSTTGHRAGCWSLLLDCGHTVKKRVRIDKKPSNVPRRTECCICARKSQT